MLSESHNRWLEDLLSHGIIRFHLASYKCQSYGTLKAHGLYESVPMPNLDQKKYIFNSIDCHTQSIFKQVHSGQFSIINYSDIQENHYFVQCCALIELYIVFKVFLYGSSMKQMIVSNVC